MENKIVNSKVIVGLTNPKSPSNVGSVMRAAGCYQVEEVLYTGQRYANAAKFTTDTKNVSGKIPLTQVDSFIDENRTEKIICVELVEGATPLPYFEHPTEAIYIFGPEDGSLSQQVVNKADYVVYVPTIGCMNLAATVNVVLYDRLAKQKNLTANDDLIKQSRDTNNRVKLLKTKQ